MASRSLPRIFKIGVVGAGGLLAMVLLLFLLLPHLLDTNAIKQTLSERVAQATGLEVVIEGDLHFRLLPGLRVTADAVRLGTEGNDLAFAERLVLGIDLLPLLRRETSINRIIIQEPMITLARNADGEFAFRRPRSQAGSSTSLKLQHFAVEKGTVRYSDARSGTEFTALECTIKADNVLLAAGSAGEMFANTDLTAQLGCAELKHNAFKLGDLHATVLGKQGSLTLDPVTMTLFGTVGTASLHSDFTGILPQHTVNLALPQFHIEAFLNDVGAPPSAQGSMDFKAALTMQGSTLETLGQTMSGQISLHGEQLVVLGVDIDDEIARYESSQNFNLVDVGAFFFAGPLGLMVTKGYDFVNIMQGTGTRSEIRALVSDWTVTEGVAQAQDVAMSTVGNRLALQGSLDFHQGQFVDVTFALIDARGCPNLEQVINGSFRNPELDQSGILKSLAGPVLSLLQQGLDLVQDSDCEPFYTGSVPAPQ